MKMVKMADNKYPSRTDNNPAGKGTIGKKDDHSGRALIISSMFLLLIFSLLSLVAGYGFAQECDGTQWKTDNRGLVFVPKGQKETLLIGGVWYDCWGCGDCIPVSGQAQQPRPTVQPRRPRQELSDEEMIALIERTKELTGRVKALDEVRAQAESKAFRHGLFVLSRELKLLPDQPIPQFEGLKLKLQDLAEKATTVKEMANIARWSLQSAHIMSRDEARRISGWGFDEWGASAGVRDLSQLAPEIPLPETKTPQFIAFKYIADWAADMHAKILRLSEGKNEYDKKAWELREQRSNMLYRGELPPLKSSYTEDEKKKMQLYEDLEKQAAALLKEANQMFQEAMDYSQQVSEMERELIKLINDPSKCEDFLSRQTIKK
ncbi:MAG: hypothetical protein OP8BY_2370 [Candidatus Saccharicenans subterraneus]|uniref:Uncharacterized protein n=1 Tax=Candidatus Saccharicenans subterraneus TaxID=2508984 RepID=A0A3E2BJ63_9BACT|nr:MAG: hypothetical protein OP8BY_2370 [Candidatus Saccharicenans subterraneum]